MMKDHEFHKNTGKVFSKECFDKKIINSKEKVAYTEDKDFVLVYTDKDIENLHDIWGFREYNDYISGRSIEDEIFDSYINEFEIEENKYKNYKILIKEILDDEKIIRFMIDGSEMVCLINIRDCITKGSSILLLVGDAKNNVYICGICKKDDDKGVKKYE